MDLDEPLPVGDNSLRLASVARYPWNVSVIKVGDVSPTRPPVFPSPRLVRALRIGLTQSGRPRTHPLASESEADGWPGSQSPSDTASSDAGALTSRHALGFASPRSASSASTSDLSLYGVFCMSVCARVYVCLRAYPTYALFLFIVLLTL